MIFDRKIKIEVPEFLLQHIEHRGFTVDELLHNGIDVIRNSLLSRQLKIALRDLFSKKKKGLLVINGTPAILDICRTLASEIALMRVPDVMAMDSSPLVLNYIETRGHVQAALVASHHCTVIATLCLSHEFDFDELVDLNKARLSSIAGQPIDDTDIDLLGVVQICMVKPALEDGWQGVQPALAVRFKMCGS